MIRSCATVCIVLIGSLLAPLTARANGRPPATMDVRFAPESTQDILVSSTMGLFISHDDGASFDWVCETAVGYTGTFDPDYALASDGTIFASTPQGLRISRDRGCVWELASEPLDVHWISDVEIGPDGVVWIATSTSALPNDVYRSADGGRSFEPRNMKHPSAWWKSVRVAPSDGQRIYISGYLVAADGSDAGPTGPAALLYRSEDGGQSWTELPTTDFELGAVPQLFVQAVATDNPDVVYARSQEVDRAGSDVLYRSMDKGQTWQEILRTTDQITDFVIRQNGDLLVSTVIEGIRMSSDGGATWTPPASQPRAECLGERSDGQLFACGANWDPDFFALGRSTDGQRWEKVFRFSELRAPYECPAGTVQAETCTQQWSGLCQLYGCDRPDAGPTPPPDAAPNPVEGTGGGCCDASAGPAGTAVLAASVLLLLGLRRRRKSSCCSS